ncbi:MAG: DUF3179 domain-containing protein [Planctomycetia bacterium]|nr:DUF3179 domain-containing protein [Planctomycetia bacterium]
MLKKYLLIILFIFLGSCNIYDDIWGPPYQEEEWLLDEDQIQQGCYSGKDCIPSLESPEKSEINGNFLEYLKNDDLVIGIWNGTDYIAYPHPIMNWHEVVNENGYCISFCPITGSAVHFVSQGEFGVSGLLFNANLIMYDRDTDSYWEQMMLKSVAGKLKGKSMDILPLLETTWENWKNLFPNTKVLNSNTDLSKKFSNFDYSNEKISDQKIAAGYIPIPISQRDNRLPLRERVLTIIDNEDAIAFPISDYLDPTILSLKINDNKYILVISARDNIAMAFKTNRKIEISKWDIQNGEILFYDIVSGDKWNILGLPLIDNRTSLKPANSYIAYWFAVAAIFPKVEIFSQ